MSRFPYLNPIAIASAIALGSLAGSVAGAQAPRHQTMTPGFEPLRSVFNAETENVRAILLASPT